MDEITLFHFEKKDTIFHSLNPVLKIILILVFSTLTIFYNCIGLLYLTAFITILLIQSKISFMEILQQSRFFVFFLFFILAAYSFSSEGEIIFQLSFFKISADGISAGLFQCWKFCLLILCSIFFTSTTDPSSFAKSIYFILKPIPLINHRRIASISGMSLILLPKVLDNYKATSDALTSRCFSKNKNIFSKLKIMSTAIITSNLVKINNISDAYLSRNYNDELIDYSISLNQKDILTFLLVLIVQLMSLFSAFI